MLESKIERVVSDYQMDAIYDSAIIGFSGGADSSAILHYLKDKTKKLLCVHINHMIRGNESLRDEFFCKSVCEKYGVKFASYRVDVPYLAQERKKGIEETAREERYRIFEGLLKEGEYKCVITAHNANDNAETILFNLTRGCGLDGICGIKAEKCGVLRPMIMATREEILDYCKRNEIDFVSDSTNFNTDYTRNYIRHTVIPALEKINPCLVEACTRLSDTMMEDKEYFDKIIDNIIIDNNIEDKIDINLFNSLEYPIKSRLLKRLGGKNIDYVDLQSCIKLLKTGTAGKKINLSQGISFKIEHGYAKFIKTKELDKVEYIIPIKEGKTQIPQLGLILVKDTDDIPYGYKKIYSIGLNKDEINGELIVRSKRDGDTIFHGGMTKKLKKIMTDRHIPSHLRDKMPIICDSRGIVSVVGFVKRDKAKGEDIIISIYKKETVEE